MKILIIEDNPDIAANIGDYLDDRGHVVDFAGDGVTGLHLASAPSTSCPSVRLGRCNSTELDAPESSRGIDVRRELGRHHRR